MDPLSLETRKTLERAMGYHELGLHEDSLLELDQVSPLQQKIPPLILLRAQILNAMGEFAHSVQHLESYETICADSSEYPILLAYASRRANCVEAAKAVLEKYLSRFPDEPLLSYNLACYLTQLGQFAPALNLLKAAIALNAQYRSIARKDPDFLPLKDHRPFIELVEEEE